jgi:hypothetical protein
MESKTLINIEFILIKAVNKILTFQTAPIIYSLQISICHSVYSRESH